MSDGRNPNALPFRPAALDGKRREQYCAHVENQPQPPPPPAYHAPPASSPWNTNYSSPHFYEDSHQAHSNYAAQAQAQAYYYQWAQHYGYTGHQAGPSPYGLQPCGQQPQIDQTDGFQQPHYNAPPAIGYQSQRHYSNPAYYHRAMQSQANLPAGATNEDLQASTPPLKKSKFGAAANVQAKQKDTPKAPKASTRSQKKGRYGEEKIMLPAPQPTTEYLSQTAEEPSAIDPPSTGNILVILDLNGTVLFRPNRNAKTMIERPFLKRFLHYLFQNFKVMVWSSAKPDNVRSLVHQSLDNDLRSKLIAHWARDSFGLSPTNYNLNVQVYKNLRLVWSRDQIQQHHPGYAAGQRFGQHNTVLIDDSAIKASAQPYNLLEIPEFSATPEQMKGDVLREVAGYLEILRQQADVSKLIRKEPFKDDGRWNFQWPDEVAGGGEMQSKVSMKRNTKESLKKIQAEAAAAGEFDTEGTEQTKGQSDALDVPLSETIDSLSSVSLSAPMSKD